MKPAQFCQYFDDFFHAQTLSIVKPDNPPTPHIPNTIRNFFPTPEIKYTTILAKLNGVYL